MVFHRHTLDELFHFIAHRFAGVGERAPPSGNMNAAASKTAKMTRGEVSARWGPSLVVPEQFAADPRLLLSTWVEDEKVWGGALSPVSAVLPPQEEWRLPGNEWMVFVELLRVLSKPRPSEYELYHTFASYYTAAVATDDEEKSAGVQNRNQNKQDCEPSLLLSLPSLPSSCPSSAHSSAVIRERPLVWADWGACCFDRAGQHITRGRGHEALSRTKGALAGKGIGDSNGKGGSAATALTSVLPAAWCDLEVMHDELARHFDYVTCHRHLRPDMPDGKAKR